MKKILFPTDFSTNAMNAFNYALHIADKIGAEITTLHTYENPDLGRKSPSATVKQIQEYELQDQFDTYRKAAEQMRSQTEQEILSQIKVDHVLKEGDLIDILKEMVALEKPEMIIMGTRGANTLKQLFIGSNTAKVIEALKLPVLAIPQNASYKPIQNIVYATDIEELNEVIIPKAYEFSQMLGAKMHIVHVNTRHTQLAYQVIAQWEKKMSTIPNIYFEVVESNDVLTGINRYAKDHAIDMVAMLTHHRNFLDKLFSISYTQKAVFQTEIPLLAYEL